MHVERCVLQTLLQGNAALGAAQFQSGPTNVAVGVVNGTLLGEHLSRELTFGWAGACQPGICDSKQLAACGKACPMQLPVITV